MNKDIRKQVNDLAARYADCCIEDQYAALTPEHKKMVDDKISVLLIGQKNTALGVGSTQSGEAEQV